MTHFSCDGAAAQTRGRDATLSGNVWLLGNSDATVLDFEKYSLPYS